jgi:hypothetical protein
MNKSYSKIRHIQESNLRLERRFLNEESESDHPSLKGLEDSYKERERQERESAHKEYEERELIHRLKEVTKSVAKGLNNHIVPGSERLVHKDDSTEEMEFKLKIYKKVHNFPPEISSEVEKLTENPDDVLMYLKDKIKNNPLHNHSDEKRFSETDVEYVGEENDDYVFLIKIKYGYK